MPLSLWKAVHEKENNEKLWGGLEDGVIDFIITDHSPATPEIKELETGNLKKAWGGIASLQFSLSAIWKKSEEHNNNVSDIARLMSENVAKFLKLEASKGLIKKGYDADIVVWNPEKSFVATTESIKHRHKISPYVGYELKGEVVTTYVNGEKVYEQDKFIALNKGKIILNKNGK